MLRSVDAKLKGVIPEEKKSRYFCPLGKETTPLTP